MVVSSRGEVFDIGKKRFKKLFFCHREVGVAIGEIIAEVGEVVAAVVFFIDHVRVGDDGEEWKGSIHDVEPVGVLENWLLGF